MNDSPSKHIIALFTAIGLLPLVYFIPEAITQHVSSNKLIVSALSVTIIVPIISYLWLPVTLKSIKKLTG